MGEYWKPVNVTKREYIHPHDMNDGLKLGEWTRPESATSRLMADRWSADDVVIFVSDYDGYQVLRGTVRGKRPTYQSLDEDGYQRVTRQSGPPVERVAEPAADVVQVPRPINISELEALRAKMAPELGEDDIIVDRIHGDENERGLLAEHNAMPALLTAIKAALAYRDAIQSRLGPRYRSRMEDAEQGLFAALEAVTL